MHVGAATSTDSTRRDTHFQAGQERYLRKHFGALGWQAARAGQWLGAVARGVVLPSARGEAARQRAEVLRRGPRRVEATSFPRPERRVTEEAQA